jgi:Polyglycine hydrolase-like, structural repeat
LVYVNAYVQDGKTRFVAIVSGKASPSYAARHGLASKAYQAEREKCTGKGLSTQAVTGYAAGGSHRFAGLWR